MFKKPILFVVGAGASCEVSLPAGEGLKRHIANKIDIRYEHGVRKISGDDLVEGALRRYAGKTDPRGNINPCLASAWQLREALPQALSIDNLLDAHRGDEKFELCGKLGIAASIIEAERNSLLHYNPDRSSGLDFNQVANTWFSKFTQLLTQGVAKADIGEIFANVSFITFNYDRCIEHFLILSLANYYGIELAASAEIVKKLTIIHPYGVVGRLPWQSGTTQEVSYGSEARIDLLDVAAQIKTFTQQIDDEVTLTKIRGIVSNAENIVFLGYAFHQQNMQIIQPETKCRAGQVLATGLEISSADCRVVKHQILRLLGKSREESPIEILNGSCNNLFKEYWRTLSAA